MEERSNNFDVLLGGKIALPADINVVTFANARAKEIAYMQHCIDHPKSTKLAFQKLPLHMRRRVMSHHAKRLPRHLREKHLSQLKKAGMPPKQKRPSRRFRRRPANLRAEYARRQHRVRWLETHIWHAKRFHMIERWNFKLPERRCDKAFRALYRASAKHCLLQDKSYYGCIELSATREIFAEKLKLISSPKTGFSFMAKSYINGNREGSIYLYHPNKYPYEAIGQVSFIWKFSTDPNKRPTLWLWAHPSFYHELFQVLTQIFGATKNLNSQPPTYSNQNNVTIKDLYQELNRFRLTGPLSHSVLVNSLKISSQCHTFDFWRDLKIFTPAELSPRLVIGLDITDPRFNFPAKRTKAVPLYPEGTASDIPSYTKEIASSQIWDHVVRKKSLDDQLTNRQICDLRSKQLVPGLEDATVENLTTCPVLVIQRPGSSHILGYGCGYDVIVPKGWGLPLWHTMIMWGARAGGLREDRVQVLEDMNGPELAPDSKAGREENLRTFQLQKAKYFRLPPNKRVNYNKFGIVNPFQDNWRHLLQDWTGRDVDSFYVLRDREKLKEIHENMIKGKRKKFSDADDSTVLIPVKLVATKRGLIQNGAIICLPHSEDFTGKVDPIEPEHVDVNQAKRKTLRQEHLMTLKRLKRQRFRVRKLFDAEKRIEMLKTRSSVEQIKQQAIQMQQLWLPESKSIRNSCSRDIIGFVTNADYSFAHAKSVAVGFIVAPSLHLISRKLLVRNSNSKQYRFVSIEINC